MGVIMAVLPTLTLASFLFMLPFFCSGVPVLIWESSAVSDKEDLVPALIQLDIDEFTNHVIQKVHAQKPLVALFLEESLSIEDFSWQDDRHRGSFPQIQNITSMAAKMEFLPSVEEPVEALKGLTETHGFQWDEYEPGKQLPQGKGIILEVKLGDATSVEDRPELLRRHDGDVAEIYSRLLAKHSHIVAIFTGRQSAWVEPEMNRVRREALDNETIEASTTTASPRALFVIEKPNYLVLYSDNYPELVDDGEVVILSENQTELHKADVREGFLRMPLTVSFGGKSIKLRFRFENVSAENKWELSEVQYEKNGDKQESLKPLSKIQSPMHMSYASHGPVEFSNGKAKLTFSDLRVQPWPTSNLLSESEDKEQFFTATIWSGLFVSFILALIFTWGITMLLDVRTMDRFDDPKGKTIVVNVND